MHGTPRYPGLIHLLPWIIYGLPVLLAIAALGWGLVMVHLYRRDGRRQREGLCLKCGYDLRRATDRCPECGAPMRLARPERRRR